MNRKIEILAPAGSYEGMRAAMNAGCDAVYIGGSSFGARAYAENPEEDTLLQAIDEAHIRDKKLYLTVNTLLKEKELTGNLYRFLDKYYLQGLDAVIVQDVGVLHFIHRNFPGLQVHASTQMTLTMAQGANLLKDYGVTRLVTSRELSLREIKTIRENTELEIETFVHGALCYCYSGQCLMSSMIGGRSGNRGRCAQPCRMPYQLYADNKKLSTDQEKYLLSPKDINTLTIIPELIEAGIDSFKIEGRMKRPEYAAAVSSIYRKYVDLYFNIGKEGYNDYLESNEFRQDMLDLQDVYNRGGFSEGYGKTYHGKKMMSLYRPNHSGVYVGEVKEIKGSQVAIALNERINAQDILEIRHMEEEAYEFTVKDPHEPGDILWTNTGRRPDSAWQAEKGADNRPEKNTAPAIRIKDPVYRTKNNQLLDRLAEEYLGRDKKQGIRGYLTAKAGERLSLKLCLKDWEITAYQGIVEKALKQPMTREKLAAPITKTGDTLYYFEELSLDAEEDIFVPVAWLNEIRREAINLLQEEVIKHYRRNVPNLINYSAEPRETMAIENSQTEDRQPVQDNEVSVGISVLVQSKEQYRTAVSYPEISVVYVDYDSFSVPEIINMAQETTALKKEFYLALPQICRLAVYERLKKDINVIIEKDEIKGFLVKNFEEIALLQPLCNNGKSKKKIILNYNMYTYNKEAKSFWREQDITRFTAPVEQNFQELRELGIEDCDMIVYGYQPLMISAQCLFESTKGCRKPKTKEDHGQEKQSYFAVLTDRMGKSFFVKTNCTGCYNIIYNGQALALYKQADEILRLKPGNIRLDFCKESAEETKKVLEVFINRFRYNRMLSGELTDYTTGHFKRGVE